MGTVNEIDAKLNAEHAALIADAELVARAQAALPLIKAKLDAAKRTTADYAAETGSLKSMAAQNGYWNRSGGRDAYAREIALWSDLTTLTVLSERRAPTGWDGWLTCDAVDRAFRHAEGR